jgi:hypothetical protein
MASFGLEGWSGCRPTLALSLSLWVAPCDWRRKKSGSRAQSGQARIARHIQVWLEKKGEKFTLPPRAHHTPDVPMGRRDFASFFALRSAALPWL